MKVLLIEDSDLQARMIQDSLGPARSGRRFSVERAARLQDGLRRLARDGFDALLLDLNLPDSRGVETFETVAARAPASPIIVLTTTDDDALAMEALDRGAQDYLLKSEMTGSLLSRVIRYAVERKRVDAALRSARDELERRVGERTSELTAANARLTQRTRELERVNHELSQFASVAAHELQEPLRKIITYGDLLERRSAGALDPKAGEYLRTMKRAAARQRELVVSLGELTQVTMTQRPMREVELGDVVRRASEGLAAAFAAAGASVRIGPLPRVKGDPLQLEELFRNLLDNALKYREPSRPLLVAVTSRPAPPAGFEVTVEDNGGGFEQRYAEQIFEPFKRLRPDPKIKGTGIGLALCARIVWRHGGRISAVGRPGEGAAFTVAFPAGKQD